MSRAADFNDWKTVWATLQRLHETDRPLRWLWLRGNQPDQRPMPEKQVAHMMSEIREDDLWSPEQGWEPLDLNGPPSGCILSMGETA